MRVLLDECLPRSFKRHLQGHECATVPDVGWAGKKNGELLKLAEGAGFEVFLTLDRGIEYEQQLSRRKISILLIRANSSRFDDLVKHRAEVLNALRSMKAGDFVRVGYL